MRITGTIAELVDNNVFFFNEKEREVFGSYIKFFKEDTVIEVNFEQTSIGTVIKVTTPPLDITDYTSW